jgi:hypothetical protein
MWYQSLLDCSGIIGNGDIGLQLQLKLIAPVLPIVSLRTTSTALKNITALFFHVIEFTIWLNTCCYTDSADLVSGDTP